MKICAQCGKELKCSQTKYCSNKCQQEFQKNNYIKRWKKGEENGLCGKYAISSYIRNYLLEKNNYQCQKCHWGEKNPITGKIPLEIHHIDGDYRNMKEENLEVLCPNCHSLTPNFGSLNKRGRGETNTRKNYCIDCGISISTNAIRCNTCASKMRITKKPVSREELKKLIREESFVAIGKNFGVSDNAIRKWCINYNLPTRKKDIKSYSDEEWINI